MKNIITSLLLMLSLSVVYSQTVLDIIVDSDAHNTLETAVLAAELDGALSAPNASLTVFAPTDDAFAAIPADVLDGLLADPTTLSQILLYHVVGSTALSSDLSNGMMIETLQGGEVMVTISNNVVMINNAIVTIANLEADNGVVHVIDAVIQELPENVLDVVVGSDVHNTLETAVLAAGLDGALSDPDASLTVFAPTDDAFAVIPAEVLEGLLADPTALSQILLYHVVGSSALSSDLSNGMMIETLQGGEVMVTIMNGVVKINEATVTVSNILTYNGVVHVIDAVIQELPENVLDVVVGSDVHNTLETAVLAAGLDGALSDPDASLTVFAPTDNAFAVIPPEYLEEALSDPSGLLTQILLYHVVGSTALSTDLSDEMMIETLQGNDLMISITNGIVKINDATVTVADILTYNGVVHVIDAVLVPPMEDFTVLDIIENSEDHNTLETAVLAAGLDGALSDPDATLTVFAPTDDAFSAIPSEVLDALLADPTGDLTQILLYHVVGSIALSSDLSDGMMIETLQGDEVMVSLENDIVIINNAMVTVADIEADNGVVHVVDAVLENETSSVESVNTLTDEYYLYSVDLSGKIIDPERRFNQTHQIVFDVYSSGKVVKRITLQQ